MRFTKMHGLGNDYIYVNMFDEHVDDPSRLAVSMSRAHFGVHSDGLVLIGPSDVADYSMRMFNADGSEGEMCGNAARCIGKYVFDRGLTKKTHVTLETRGGIRVLELQVSNGVVNRVRVDMGEPLLGPRDIPVVLSGEQVVNYPVEVAGRAWRITCVNMGNPHAVIFVDDPWSMEIEKVGREIELSDLFPNRTNVEFVRAVSHDRLEMRVWERGSGETLACGTGAAATLVAAVLNGLANRAATIKLAGGELFVTWDVADNHIYQTGPATFVFDGVWFGD